MTPSTMPATIAPQLSSFMSWGTTTLLVTSMSSSPIMYSSGFSVDCSSESAARPNRYRYKGEWM